MKLLRKMMLPFLLTMIALTIFSEETEAAIDNKPGDIIITNSTASSGITGHTGIYIDATHILHTSGRKSEPYPIVFTEKEWHGRYAKSKVIRPKSSSLGKDAAKNAIKYFKDKKIPYSLKDAVSKGNKNITNIYCSELVYYSYHKAGLNLKVKSNYSPIWGEIQGLVEPYMYINSEIVEKNKYKFIDNKW
ncbi:hypothetical protein ACIQXQ_15415 [Peribacillus sp. NPDC097198]|uniref:hypothetical protein n=1 Tax=Peribacillus sp. NPDC097198 TaxID=3364397 RepID=UPI00381A9686